MPTLRPDDLSEITPELVGDPRAVRNARRDGRGWLLELRGGGVFAAGFLIDATGRAAAVARKLGARRRADEKLVAVIGCARAVSGPAAVERSMIETVQEGWWYAALQPDRTSIFMLHTIPGIVGHPLAHATALATALARTRLIANAFSDPIFDRPLSGCHAGGAWFDPAHSEGWVACVDAALAFDPCAAQGKFSALWRGMAAADAVDAALVGDPAPRAAYANQLREIRRTDRACISAHYAEERRWPETPFRAGRAAPARSPGPPSDRGGLSCSVFPFGLTDAALHRGSGADRPRLIQKRVFFPNLTK
jgi:flavin-dependent dehydrogenase